LAGLSEKQVAAKLQVSRHTVHTHVRQIYRSLKVRSRAELLARFVQQRSDQEPSEI
jgi:DNA-binding NarL/FixJ family response regulator